MAHTPGRQLTLTVPRDGVLALAGEVDLASVGAMEAAITAQLIEATDTLVVDLSGVEFMDSTGLRVLLLAQQACEERGAQLLLSEPSAQVRHLLEITGLAESFPTTTCPDEKSPG